MRIECPSCGVSGTADDSYGGKKIRCPKCDEVFFCRQEDEPVEVAEEVERVQENEVEDDWEDAEDSYSDGQEELSVDGGATEEQIEDHFDFPDSAPEQTRDKPDNELIVELCDYCSGEGKPGERLEVVDMKKACSDCLPLLTGAGGKTTNRYPSVAAEFSKTQGVGSDTKKQGKTSLVGSFVGRFKKIFTR